MKPAKIISIIALLVSALLAQLPAFGQSTLPAEKTEGNISYLTGGVGKDEAAAMKAAQKSYPLSLEFVQKTARKEEYLASVNVEIKDHKGEVLLKTATDGPYLYAKLPNGKYLITAEFEGKSKSRHVAVSDKHPKHLDFVWK
ncbi:hypothetical protein AAKU67_001690 [Oxalobacteraceae bacterium GrIS 2.11]